MTAHAAEAHRARRAEIWRKLLEGVWAGGRERPVHSRPLVRAFGVRRDGMKSIIRVTTHHPRERHDLPSPRLTDGKSSLKTLAKCLKGLHIHRHEY